MKQKRTPFSKLISIAALLALAGFILSGPVGLLVVSIVHPQPPWVSPAVFAASYHPTQEMPYYFGFLLVIGMLMLSCAHYPGYAGEDAFTKVCLSLSLMSASVFCTLISFNYICQTTYLRNLVLHYRADFDPAIAMLSMSNPLSFCWASEMWGYGVLGISTGLGARHYDHKGIYAMMTANGIASITGVMLTINDAGWLLTPVGIAAYLSCIVLMVILMLVIHRNVQKLHSRLNNVG